MLFYKAKGTLTSNTEDSQDARKAQRTNARKIAVKSEEFNQKYCRDSYYFVSDSSDGIITLGIILAGTGSINKTLNSYLKHIGCEASDIVISEITFGAIQNLLSGACYQNYIADDDEIMEKYGLDKISGRRGRALTFGENIIDEKDKSEIYASAQRLLIGDTLIPELDRIYIGSARAKPYGHPAHYIFKTDDKDTRKEAYKTLLQALYANKRLSSKRYCFVDFKPGENFAPAAYDTLYKVCSGGAVVLRCLVDDNCENSNLPGSERAAVEALCAVIRRYCNRTLTIICLPCECEKTKALFYENLGTMAFVEIQEDYVEKERACSFLKALAKENHIPADKALFARLEENKKYLSHELCALFESWQSNKLRSSIYPQYKQLKTAQAESESTAPKGTAYNELQSMVGLDEAKAVIQKALNYYKMQKLYEQKGIKKDFPSMHMVFTGNPGTAKTTAARLFAQIMKDNGLLSKGQLIEVGRGDLVGKYVGWTAQTVAAKFKDAVGGVLFIDEAYSLVDDRSGSFGDEAINTIVQEMENHREDVVVIFAGYPDKMESFLKKNPGLRSRIAFHVPFADYSARELCQIAAMIGKSKGVSLEDAAIRKLEGIFEAARRQCDFGNGRFARNLLEQAKMNQASRLLEYDFDDITAEEITIIKAEDISGPNIKYEEKRLIGFSA